MCALTLITHISTKLYSQPHGNIRIFFPEKIRRPQWIHPPRALLTHASRAIPPPPTHTHTPCEDPRICTSVLVHLAACSTVGTPPGLQERGPVGGDRGKGGERETESEERGRMREGRNFQTSIRQYVAVAGKRPASPSSENMLY